MTDGPTPAALDPPDGARVVLLRAAIGVVLGVVPAGLSLAAMGTSREWHFHLGLGLFLGGMTGLGGFVERAGARRGAWAQVGLAVAFSLLVTVWALASIFQAQWTVLLLTAGADKARDGVEELLRGLLRELDVIPRLFLPLGAVVGAHTLARTRRAGAARQLAYVAVPLVVGTLTSLRSPGLLTTLGVGLVATNAASAWAAAALARRWWPSPDAEASLSQASG